MHTLIALLNLPSYAAIGWTCHIIPSRSSKSLFTHINAAISWTCHIILPCSSPPLRGLAVQVFFYSTPATWHPVFSQRWRASSHSSCAWIISFLESKLFQEESIKIPDVLNLVKGIIFLFYLLEEYFRRHCKISCSFFALPPLPINMKFKIS